MSHLKWGEEGWKSIIPSGLSLGWWLKLGRAVTAGSGHARSCARKPGSVGMAAPSQMGLWAPCQPVGTVQGVFTGHPIPTVSGTNLKLAGVPTP